MLIVLKPCGSCAAPNHRMILLRLIESTTCLVPNSALGLELRDAWTFEPWPSCVVLVAGARQPVIIRDMVVRGVVWRIVDELGKRLDRQDEVEDDYALRRRRALVSTQVESLGFKRNR